ncbi:hypothetical protein VNI00_013191 [Paramarasmius palmivorus]|uniref:FAD-binding PCMH-type domain-containing protein n=1 Tax=Paramarasmius palmivorus TaxID=297713 RepID=A0AAW0BZG4_9AGAR
MAFNNPSHFTVHGGAHNVVHGNQIIANQTKGLDNVLHLLAARAAVNATRDAEKRYPPPNCHLNTRVRVLDILGSWIGSKDTETRVFWVHGSAGVGKTAIAQTLSEIYDGRLVAVFFFSRNDSTRDKLEPLVATIAFQCCTSDLLKDAVGPFILDAIQSNPNIFQTTSENQFRRLVLEPFAKAKAAQPHLNLPDLIVIDGLDECVDLPSQARLVEIIDIAISSPTPAPFKFLLCSRPEPQIRTAIDNANFMPYLERLPISDTTIRFQNHFSESDLDIERYFLDKFSELRKKYRVALREEGQPWPSEDDIRDLVWRASGQFIFAVTVMKYIDTMDERPQDRLATILDIEPSDITESPYPALDALYRQVLSTCRHWQRVQPILRLLVDSHVTFAEPFLQIRWHSPSVIANTFRLKNGEVETLLSRLHSVLFIPEDGDTDLRILHASFTEFLLDKTRSREFYSPEYAQKEYYDHATVLFLRILSSFTVLYPPHHTSNQSFSTMLVRWLDKIDDIGSDTLPDLSIRHWAGCCRGVASPSANMVAELNAFDPYSATTLMIEMNILNTLCDWKECLEWAKSLEDGAPQSFIEKMDLFLQGCFICLKKDSLRRCAIRDAFDMESMLASSRDRSRSEHDAKISLVDLIIDKEYEHLWSEHVRCWDYRPVLLPLTSNPAEILPPDWFAVRVTKANGSMLNRVVFDGYESFDEDGQRILENDLLEDTFESVSRTLVKEEDLAQFKTLVYQRRYLLGGIEAPILNIIAKRPAPGTRIPELLRFSRGWLLTSQVYTGGAVMDIGDISSIRRFQLLADVIRHSCGPVESRLISGQQSIDIMVRSSLLPQYKNLRSSNDANQPLTMKHQLLTITSLSLLGAKFVYGTSTAACNALQSALPGRVFFPGSEEYTSDNKHWTQIASQNSTCSVQPESPDDVAVILRAVASSDTQSPFGVKGGGHTSNAGFSSTPGVQISMSRFNSVEYNENQSTAKIGAGLTWGEVFAALEPHGVKAVGGRVPNVGVAGFVLGGGYSYFTDQYGLAIDTVVAYDLVLPNGTFIEVKEQSSPDLFFALKGGFNNFGIVTSFTLNVFPQTDVWGGTVVYPLNASDAVHRATENFSFNNTDLKAVALTLYTATSFNQTTLLVNLFYDGPTPPSGVFDEFLNVPGAVVTLSRTMGLTEAVDTLSGGIGSLNPPRDFRDVIPVSRYTVGILDEMKAQLENVISDAATNNRVFEMLGVISEPFAQPNAHSTDSAYPNPPGRFVCPTGVEGYWLDSADDDFFFNAISEAKQAIQARAIAEGQSFADDIIYNNYAPADTPLELLYGDNLERLKEIKERVDPENVMGLAGGFKFE